MRRFLFLLAVLAAGLTLVAPGEARQFATGTGGAGSSAGSFFGGFTPTNIVNQPVNLSGVTKPVNYQQTIMPQQQSTKVFSINSAIRNVQIPVFKSQAPAAPAIPAGMSNPIQQNTSPIRQNPGKVAPQSSFLGLPF